MLTGFAANPYAGSYKYNKKINLKFIYFILFKNEHSGQYVSVSYILSGVACLLSAICFAEFAARIKMTSGSSYSFIYYSLGELFAFMTGWMILNG